MYVFRCPVCGDVQEYGDREPKECPLHDDPVEMRRDYRAESASLPTAKLKRWNHSRTEREEKNT